METQSLVYLIGDDQASRNSLSKLLKTFKYSVDEFSGLEEFKHQKLFKTPSVIVIDIQMSQLSEIDIQLFLQEKQISIPIIIMSGSCTQQEIIELFKKGVLDFLIKPFDSQELLDSIQKGFQISLYQSQLLVKNKIALERFGRLSLRERDVCELLVRGLRTQEIATTLEIAEATVKIHKARVFKKMESRSIVEIMRLTDTLSTLSQA